MKNSFFSRFTPKEPKFFPLLKQLSEVLSASSVALVESLQHDQPTERSEYYKKIKDLEREGDRLTHLIFDELGTTFITPFDREDIHDLASCMDDVIDGINSCAKRISIYNPRPISESGKELSRLIQEEAIYICKAMDELETFRKKPTLLREYCSKLHEIENQADDVYEFFITKLFEEEKDCIFNFVAFFIAKYIIGGFGIANTVSKTVVEQYITLPIILAGVIAAITWNLITWWKGIPSSSSHTLIGGFAGAAIMANGFEAIQLNIILKIAAFIFLAPFIGMVIAFGFTLFVLYICRRAHPHTAEQWFKRLQLVSSALFSVGHGLNDSQKVMGIIAAAMIAAHSMGLGMGINSINDLPDWVAFSCFTAISLGTMSGGWKIVKTMGTRITKVTPLEGVIAETAGAFTLYITEMLKIPVSTTHTITGAIIGVGATKRLSAVRWGVTKSLMTAWILTIPVSGLLAAGVYFIVSLFI